MWTYGELLAEVTRAANAFHALGVTSEHPVAFVLPNLPETVHPLVQNFDERGWVGGAWRTMLDKTDMRAAAPKATRAYAWVLFRPETEALSEMAGLVELGRLSLPIGIRAPLRHACDAFDHMRRRLPGRALIVP